MPSGTTHDQVTVVAAVGVGLALLLTGSPSESTLNRTIIASGALLVSGLLVSPDLDTASSIYDRWGVLKWLWWPYQTLMPHRSWLSHGWLVAPWIRLGYCCSILFLLSLGSYLWGQLIPYRDWWHVLAAHPDRHWFLGGWWLGSALHSLADMIGSAMQIRRPKRRR